MMRAIRWAAMCGLLLALFAGQVLALGLGRIEVKSRAGQPLLAEIQVISSDSGELDQLRAGLASPDTFRRIGLPAPDSVVAGLEFAVALDARGNPVIRVTTREPVTQPMLTFLVEVDWGQGRLVREYSALVDTPQTVAAPAQPAIEAPVAAPANTIVRSPEAAAAPGSDDIAPTDEAVAVDETAADAAAAAAERADAAVADEAATPPAIAPAPVATPAPMPAALPAQASAPPGEYGPVQAGETLGAIAAQLVGDGVTREQAIVALFRANPEAFIASNLNLVRQGAVLRIPDRSEIAGLDLRESRALMREQVAAWRDMTRPAPQPEAVMDAPAAAEAPEAPAPGPAGEGEAGPQPDAVARTADARLEIVPPSAAGGQQAGIRSGIQAGGEGEMLRQEMQQELHQSQETLAAREAEVDELKARVADLERLQAQQAQLITMKDSELAAVQERLSATSEPAAEAPPAAAEAGGLPWAWIGLGLLLVAAVAWMLIRRAPKPTPRPRFDAAALAAASSSPAEGESPADAPQQVPAAPRPATPAWHADAAASTDVVVPVAKAVPVAKFVPEHVPTHADTDTDTDTDADTDIDRDRDADDAAVIASLNPSPGGAERIELARAYLDLGDVDTARDLLQEVVDAGDHAARAEASRLLEGIA
ncbi:FimV/HubP family polar landmark protein [Luteimonas changyuni]|uniref:FimV/HubP family polar landmark protein n=1 Tax=Luteimonas sp. MJ145 TaxID=3129234 RepID=UPI0031BACD43